jgi:hypothetical protein
MALELQIGETVELEVLESDWDAAREEIKNDGGQLSYPCACVIAQAGRRLFGRTMSAARPGLYEVTSEYASPDYWIGPEGSNLVSLFDIAEGQKHKPSEWPIITTLTRNR